MLDAFLSVAYEHETKKEAQAQMVRDFMQLPKEELYKIASGQVKLADDDEWLEKFKGTPLFEQALGLEEACIQADIEDQQQRERERVERQQRRAEADGMTAWEKKDAIRLKKRLLDLELLRAENSGAGGGEEEAEEEAEEFEEEEPPTKKETPSKAPAQAEAEEEAEEEEEPKEAAAPLWMKLASQQPLQKEAFGTALLGAAQGAGKLLSRTAATTGKALQRGNLQRAGQALGAGARTGVRQAGQWAAQNPNAALAAGAGGLGAAALGGGMLGRATAPQR
jgi:hypothetical protein